MREDQIQNAVSFLNDPQVANASMEARVNFLQSKNLTEDEIEEALKRAQQSPPPVPASSASSQTVPSVSRVPGVTSVAPYPQSYMMQPPPVPKRDWKDYFVMATVSVGVAYGIYEVTKRYILPMIMPPTPASLDADKEALEQEFARMEALLEQVQQDTSEMKESESKRQEEYEEFMNEARIAVESFKRKDGERTSDIKGLKSHVEALREMMPKYLDKYRDRQDEVIKELQAEVKSLKFLVSNRVKSGGSGPGVPPASMVPSSVTLPGSSSTANSEPFIPDPAARAAETSSAPTNSVPPVTSVTSSTGVSPGVPAIPGVSTSSDDKPAGIPAWQLAAAKSEEAK